MNKKVQINSVVLAILIATSIYAIITFTMLIIGAYGGFNQGDKITKEVLGKFLLNNGVWLVIGVPFFTVFSPYFHTKFPTHIKGNIKKLNIFIIVSFYSVFYTLFASFYKFNIVLVIIITIIISLIAIIFEIKIARNKENELKKINHKLKISIANKKQIDVD